VVHAILVTRKIHPGDLMPELQRYGRVLADDQGLTVIAHAR
jgi:hypothetical protein